MPSTVSSGARQRSTDGTTSAISSSGMPRRRARESPPPRARASRGRPRPRRSGRRRRARARRARRRPRRGGARRARARRAVLGGPRRQLLDPAGRQRCGPPASAGATRRRRGRARTGARRSASVRPESASRSPHSAPVRSSKPYAKTGRPSQASRVRAQALDRTPAQQVAVPEPEPVELGPIGRVEERQIAVELLRLEQTGLELAERRQQGVGEAGEAAERPSPFSEVRPSARRARSAAARRS